ncbi:MULTISPECIES: hypothetical protein [unclassified Synechocystis]|uniref:hypothetical protein n=1 Tax=unclassified Synechocystis TaxID=2640012 RepID=UPI000410DB22|nr:MULTISPECIES: hypothetical protein [unclassified Synechocystis]AIE72715.1 hypothetical protein D082_01860 [Synechocystis sp. PCC 6714]MCT0254633.1 hypothetical protein [Synechocystis sp. CS-94]
MDNWVRVKGVVKAGYGVASGCSGNQRFPKGTLAMQKPFFEKCGLNLDDYYLGTINLSIAPHQYKIRQARYTFRQVKWSIKDQAEDFSFFDCRIITTNATIINGLIYYPHPETKPEHYQPPDILEIMTNFIPNLHYDDELILEVCSHQIEIS